MLELNWTSGGTGGARTRGQRELGTPSSARKRECVVQRVGVSHPPRGHAGGRSRHQPISDIVRGLRGYRKAQGCTVG